MATRTLSIFDALMSHAIESREKTYSTPLAYWSFQKETQVVDGKEVRSNPRLAFGGSHLKDPEREWTADLVARSLQRCAVRLACRHRDRGGRRQRCSGADTVACAASLLQIAARTRQRFHGGRC